MSEPAPSREGRRRPWSRDANGISSGKTPGERWVGYAESGIAVVQRATFSSSGAPVSAGGGKEVSGAATFEAEPRDAMETNRLPTMVLISDRVSLYR
jgi:hypothetical protein